MNKRSLCSAVLTLFFIVLSNSSSYGSEQKRALWFSLGNPEHTMSRSVENLLWDYMAGWSLFSLRTQHINSLDLIKNLGEAGNDKQSTIFIHCALSDYRKLIKQQETKALFSDLHLELLTPRVMTLPFYILTAGNRQVKQSVPVQIAYITINSKEIYEVEEADILTLMSQILAVPKDSIKISRERDAYTAAKKLFNGTYEFVAIYEDEPSMLLSEFQINLTEELHSPPPIFLHLDDSRWNGQLNEVVPGRLSYVFFKYLNKPFTESESTDSLPLIALLQERQEDPPVILSNIRYTQNDALPLFLKALSNSYFLIVGQNEIEPGLDPMDVQRTYLLNSYLYDSDNRYKGLGLLGYLILQRDGKGDAQEKEIYSEKCSLFMQKLRLKKTSASSLLDWLGLPIPKIDRRQLFTDDVSRLYVNALAKIGSALSSNGSARRVQLEEARTNLIAALLQGDEPRNVKGSRGLWSVSNYNPYYQLARVNFYLEMEPK